MQSKAQSAIRSLSQIIKYTNSGNPFRFLSGYCKVHVHHLKCEIFIFLESCYFYTPKPNLIVWFRSFWSKISFQRIMSMHKKILRAWSKVKYCYCLLLNPFVSFCNYLLKIFLFEYFSLDLKNVKNSCLKAHTEHAAKHFQRTINMHINFYCAH